MDKPSIEELATRLLNPGYLRASGADAARLLVGQLPEELAAMLPLPPHARVVGSQIRGRHSVEVVLDAAPEAVRAGGPYEAQLAAAGWSKQDVPHHWGGFNGGGSSMLFCRGRRGPSLNVFVVEQDAAPADVRLHLELDARHSPCAHRNYSEGAASLLPDLRPPAGARLTPSGASSGGDSAYSGATLETELELDAIYQHYVEQLPASWTRENGSGEGPMRWSTWSVVDEEQQPWQGLFFVLSTGANQYILELRVFWPASSDTRTAGGWVSSLG